MYILFISIIIHALVVSDSFYLSFVIPKDLFIYVLDTCSTNLI